MLISVTLRRFEKLKKFSYKNFQILTNMQLSDLSRDATVTLPQEIFSTRGMTVLYDKLQINDLINGSKTIYFIS